MESKYKIIGLSGRKQSGKTELALVCKENFDNVLIFSFGNALKNLCADLLNMTYGELNRIKNVPNKFLISPDDRWFNIINKRCGIEKCDVINEIGHITFTDVRMMLQVIGTNLIRKYIPNWHVDELVKEINDYKDTNKIIVVDDCRFFNEKKALEELGGHVYFILRPTNMNVSNHESEIGLTWFDFNHCEIIINDLKLDLLKEYWRLEMIEKLYSSSVVYNFSNPILAINREYNGNKYSLINPDKWSSVVAGVLLESNSIDKETGNILYNTENKMLYNLVYTKLYGQNENISEINLYNPYIIENLKMYMD